MSKYFSLIPFLVCALLSCSSHSSKTVSINGVQQRTIPGLTAVDVYGNFDKAGFQTTKNITSEISTWTSKKFELFKDYMVITTGDGPMDIVSVDGNLTYSGSDDIKAADFIGFVASIPYAGANQQAAKDWAMRNVSNAADTTIAGVHFKLLAPNDKIRTIKIFVD